MSELTVVIRRGGEIKKGMLPKQAAHMISRQDFFKVDEWRVDGVSKENDAPFAPTGYGLIVIDFDHQWVGGHQSFTRLSSAFLSPSKVKKDRQDLKYLFENGRIQAISNELDDTAVEFDQEAGWNVLWPQIKDQKGHLRVDVSPPEGWTVDNFMHTSQSEGSWDRFAQKLVALGFEFTQRDINEWDDYLDEDDGLPIAAVAILSASNEARRLDDNTQSASSVKARNLRI